MQNNPLTDAALAELDRLAVSASRGGLASLVDQETYRSELARAYPALRQRLLDAESRLEAAARERDVYHAALSEIYYRAIPLNEDSGHSTIAHIAADAMRGKNGNPLADRDARMKREGAVEAYERAADMLSVFPGGADAEEMMRDAAKRLREGKW